MRQLYLYIFITFLALTAHSQNNEKDLVKSQPDSAKKERRINIYANRKYSYGLSEAFYGFHPNSTIFHATDVLFSVRFKPLDLGNLASFEWTSGASFQPYQGFRLHTGFDYEWLTPTKVHFYIGGQYALGLKQRTIATNSLSSVTVGYHSYIVPFMGVMYWPGKRDINKLDKTDSTEKSRYRNPTFWQLVYIKGQVGYSSLFSKLTVTPTELFDKVTTSNILQNVSSGLYLSFGIGINLPSYGNIRLIDSGLLHYLKAY
jgi:hypothetical protein